MSDDTRRFTDREVALVLRRATEIAEASEQPGAAGSGLSLEDLRGIAREVGISPSAIDRAVAGLDRGPGLGTRLAGAPSVRKAARVVPVSLDQEAVAALVSLVDERADGTGAVTEALGSIRWTARDKFKSTRVSIRPGDGETAIDVVEKAEPRMRTIFHLLPAAWGMMLATPLVAAGPPAGMIGAIGIFGLSLLAGAGLGRAAWTLLSSASDRRVRRLAEAVAQKAAQVGAPQATEAPSE
jgi:hypothetical protein